MKEVPSSIRVLDVGLSKFFVFVWLLPLCCGEGESEGLGCGLEANFGTDGIQTTRVTSSIALSRSSHSFRR